MVLTFLFLFIFSPPASILALGSNDVFTLSYIDPATHATTTCSDMCFLANNASIPYQDFTVQTPINTTGIRIDISSWYGSGGGLGDVQVFQSGTKPKKGT